MAKYLKTSNYDALEDLRLHIYTIGYHRQGETILSVISEGLAPLLVLVTDCYEVAENNGKQLPAKSDGGSCENPDDENKRVYNEVIRILNTEWESAPIDLFIWTHPHDDHSIGIPRLLANCDTAKTAQILIPANLVRPDDITLCENAKTSHAYISVNHKPKIQPVAVYDFMDLGPIHILLERNESEEKIPCSLQILAPEANIAFNETNVYDPDEPNNLSIVYLLSVNGIRVFMGGDMSKENLRFIDDQFLKDLHYVKIPHHASSRDEKLTGRLMENGCQDFVAVTTQYYHGKSKLPQTETLNRYSKMNATIYSSCAIPFDDNSTYSLGVIHTVYDISNGSQTSELWGNGIVWENN